MARKPRPEPEPEPDDDLTIDDTEDDGPPARAARSPADDDDNEPAFDDGDELRARRARDEDDDFGPDGDTSEGDLDEAEEGTDEPDAPDAPPRRRRRWLGPLAVTSYVLVLLFVGLIGTLTLTYSPPPPPPPPASDIVVSLPAPPPPPRPAEAEPAAAPQGTVTAPGAAPATGGSRPPAAARPTPTPPAAPRPGQALSPAPDPALVTEGPAGPLPVVAPDGRQAWQVYARPFAQDRKRPRIAIVVQGVGFSDAATTAAIQKLPGAITLAFEPYAPDLQQRINAARAAGHEVFLQLPMEPLDYPASDPGPHTLLTSLRPEQNIDRVGWLLSRFTGYAGVVTAMGDKFTASTESLTPVLQELRDRGLMLVDARSSRNSVAAQVASDLNMPRAVNNRFIDVEASRVGIDARLLELERIAQQTGTAVGIGTRPYPVTIERLAAWAATLDGKGIDLVPVSAIANRQPVR